MEKISLQQELQANSYPGRGIVIGRSADGKKAVTAYFIMGRSENSRNRVFVEDGEGIRTQAFDPSKLTDPSLIIYAPVRVLGNKTIVTNGDQTDTIYEGMDHQLTFEQSLRSREFEPDAPNYTPRISGVMHMENGQLQLCNVHFKEQQRRPGSLQPLYLCIRESVWLARDISSIPTCATAIRSRALRVSRSWSAIQDDIDAFTEHAVEQPECGQ